jgi:hypothetical protein
MSRKKQSASERTQDVKKVSKQQMTEDAVG